MSAPIINVPNVAILSTETVTKRPVVVTDRNGNDAIAIHFENPGRDTVSGDVFDVTGSRVGSLKLGPSGDSLSWDGKDGSGQGARPGVYIYQLRGGGSSASGTVVLVR